MSIRIILTALTGVILLGCNEYTTSICSQMVLSDFARFEKPHLLPVYDETNHKVLDSIFQYKRLAEGTYASESGQKYYTCMVDGVRIIETSAKDTFSFETVSDVGDGYLVAAMGFNQSDLEAANIPFRLVATQSGAAALESFGFLEQARAMGLNLEGLVNGAGAVGIHVQASAQKNRLIIDNEHISNQAAWVKLGHPMGIQFHYYEAP